MLAEFVPFSYGRPGYGISNARQVNVFVEPSPTELAKSARFQRAGLVEQWSVGIGPVSATFRGSDIFESAVFTVSGTGVYRNQTLIGSIALGPYASIAASADQIVFVQGGEAWCYDGSTFEQIDIPDGKAVAAVVYIAARFYFLILDDDEWYFSAIDDATDIDGLAFATADSAPDASVTAAILGDQVVFFGRQTVEPWTQTGDQDAPLVRSPGSKYDKGCVAPASVVALDNRLMWVGYDPETGGRKVYVTAQNALKVSSASIDALLDEAADASLCTAFAASFDGHDFYVLTIPGKGTWAYQLDLGQSEYAWSQWTSWGLDDFRLRSGSGGYFGDSVSGRVFRFDGTVFQDDGEPIERVVTAMAGRGLCAFVELEGAVGIGGEDGSDALVDLRYSDTRGRDWSDWLSRSMGRMGQWLTRVVWTRLGIIRNLRVFELRTTANAQMAFVALKIGDPK